MDIPFLNIHTGSRIDPISAHLLKGAGTHGPIGLMYHAIGENEDLKNWKWSLSYQRFIDHLNLLKQNGWTSVTVSELINRHKFPHRTVAITFDDGYANNYSAFEALAERNMKATWFIVTGDIGTTSSWADPGMPSMAMLNSDQLRTMANSGMEIASHTRSHKRLITLDDRSLTVEVRDSRLELEDLIGNKVTSFAYPYGDHDDRVVDMVRQSGYEGACVTQTGWAMTGNDPYRIRRISIFNADTASKFSRKLVFAENDGSWAKLTRYGFDRLKDRIVK